MTETEFESAPVPRRPRTTTVLGLLAVAAATLSYLGTYAMANALVAADVLKPWPRDHDPRLRWFTMGFVVLSGLFVGVGYLARRLIARHLRQIDEMEQSE